MSLSIHRRVMPALVMMILAVIVAPVLWAPSAVACTCVDPLERAEESGADTPVFIGAAIEAVPIPQSIAQTVEWTFEVETVLQGELGPRVKLRASADDSHSCGFSPGPIGERKVIVLHKDGRSWGTRVCNIVAVNDAVGFGEPRPPNPDIGEKPPVAEPAIIEVGPDDWFSSMVQQGADISLLPVVIAAAALMFAALVFATVVLRWERRARSNDAAGR